MSNRRGRPVDKLKGQVGLRRVTGGPTSSRKREIDVVYKRLAGGIRRILGHLE